MILTGRRVSGPEAYFMGLADRLVEVNEEEAQEPGAVRGKVLGQAVALANDTEYGLAAYVYTNDLSTAIRVTEKLRFGIVGVNDINPTSAAAPFGGVKASGLGREGGYEGIDEYLDTKLVVISI